MTPLDDMCRPPGRTTTAQELKRQRPRHVRPRGRARAEAPRPGRPGFQHQLLRLRAEEHRRKCPLVWSLLKELAVMSAGGNIVATVKRQERSRDREAEDG
jgi:hypothetical protein